MTVGIAALIIIGAVVPIVTGLIMPSRSLRWFGPLWTFLPPLALTWYYAAPSGSQGYRNSEDLIFVLMVLSFSLIFPWIIWSRTVFRLLRERRAGVRHEPPRILGMRP